MIMEACYVTSLRCEVFESYDVLRTMHDCAFRRRHIRQIGPGHVMPLPAQVQRIMAGAPYLVKAGKKWRRTHYRFDPRYTGDVEIVLTNARLNGETPIASEDERRG